MKHEWRKKEKQIYLPKNKAEEIVIPEYKFLTISGEGNPNGELFSEKVQALYALSYTIKMMAKKQEAKPAGYIDYTVYPLEGVWDINEEAKKTYDGTLDKDSLVYTLMIRQPEFVHETFFQEMLEVAKKKKPNPHISQIQFEKLTEGRCVQMLHIGPFEDEPQSFEQMEAFAAEKNLKRVSKKHREIYLSDFRKVAPEKLKTVLRFRVV